VQERPAVAWGGVGPLAGAVTLLLLAAAGGYGFHRDELYFLRAGSEPALGYVDQPPLTPLLAHALDVVFHGSLVGLRLPSALIGGTVVLITGLLAREFGAERSAQVLAAGCAAVASVVLIVGHWLATATVDLLIWTLITWLVVRSLRDGGPGWLLVGLVAGVGLQNKLLPAVLLAALLVGVLVAGPRSALRSPWPWLAGLVALALWSPNLAWQVANGFPQLALAGAIAGGSSISSQPWYLFIPFQLVLVSPVLVPVWAVGWWRLLRGPRTWRGFAVAYLLLVVLFTATSGKPYYLAGFYPVLLAAGAEPVVTWSRAAVARRWVLGAAFGLSLAVSSVLALPIVPVDRLADTPVTDVNPDAGETVGWPQFVETIAEVRVMLPGERVAVLTQNYGEAGAVDHFLPALGPAHCGQNAYWFWGPPPDDATAVIVVGYPEPQVRALFGRVDLAARIDNGVRLDNTEQGRPVWIARDRRAPWAQLWPQLQRLS
jgi:Dolichyl-phosphate-mannose-protein mannosyltransferase